MYEIIICDRDSAFIGYMKAMLLRAGIKAEDAHFYSYDSGKELVRALGTQERVDLLILDMQIKDPNGDQAAKKFREQFPAAVLVFCSDVFYATTKSFEAQPYRYLLKNYTDIKMLQEVKGIVRKLRQGDGEPVIIGQYQHSSVYLKPEEILYISILKHGCRIFVDPQMKHYKDEDRIVSREKLKDLYETLKEHDFIHAHNSYIVNLKHVKRINKSELELSDGTVLSIARSKEKECRERAAQWFSRKRD